MISEIKKFFEKNLTPPSRDSGTISEHSIQMATAALLIEMMRADMKISEDERRTITEAVRTKFNLSENETGTLLQLAEEELKSSTGYYEFTYLINKKFTYEQKLKVIEHLWEVAFSDSELDKHEEHMMRKIATLIHVSHKDFINAKLRIRKKMTSR
jgi:uncharacterized tellurite resistance protein B-like protein